MNVPVFSTNVSIAGYTTFRLGGNAAFFIETKAEDLPLVIEEAKKRELPFRIIAGGSNVVVSDVDFSGLVIRIRGGEIMKNLSFLEASAGVALSELVTFSIDNSLTGLVELSGIPGSLGGAIVGNAGAYGRSVSEHLISVKIFDGDVFRDISKAECLFSYRDSVFKHKKWFVVGARFELSEGEREALALRSREIISARQKKYPPNLACPGSFFKNVLFQSLSLESQARIDKSKVIEGKVPAGYLLEAVGACGMREGGIYVAGYHGNLIINDGTGTYPEVRLLAQKLKKLVSDRFGILLEEEVRYFDWNRRG